MFYYTAQGTAVCSRCGQVFEKSSGPLACACGSAATPPPPQGTADAMVNTSRIVDSVAGDSDLTFVQKALNFAASSAKHVAAGMPQATEEQVAERFAICQSCDHFDGSACRQCGCPVVRERKFLSKLSWAGESCPVGKWGPVAS